MAITWLLNDNPIRKAYWKQSEWKFRNFHFNSRVLWDKIFTICIQNWCFWFLRMNSSESKWRLIIVFFLKEALNFGNWISISVSISVVPRVPMSAVSSSLTMCRFKCASAAMVVNYNFDQRHRCFIVWTILSAQGIII